MAVKALWARCTAWLTWVRGTHGINSTNISGPAGGDEASPHVGDLTDQWMVWAVAEGGCRCEPASSLSGPDDQRSHVMVSFQLSLE